ncbi:MAG: hypothetical protein V1891_02055 [bacterium]
MKRILVIEDDPKHLDDAKNFFENEDVKVTYVSNYNDAIVVMLKWDAKNFKYVKGDVDGVISDIYFPLTDDEQWNQPEPIGVRVAVELTQVGIPFVLNTAGYHHGRKYEWIGQFARGQRWTLIDNSGDHEKEAKSKNWKEAYSSILKKL